MKNSQKFIQVQFLQLKNAATTHSTLKQQTFQPIIFSTRKILRLKSFALIFWAEKWNFRKTILLPIFVRTNNKNDNIFAYNHNIFHCNAVCRKLSRFSDPKYWKFYIVIHINTYSDNIIYKTFLEKYLFCYNTPNRIILATNYVREE